MTTLDDRIREELKNEAREIDAMIENDNTSIWTMVFDTYRGALAPWVWVVSVVTFGITVLMFWSLYEFFFVGNPEEQIFWGVCSILAVIVQGMLKQWTFMEMNRMSLMREIKRLELALTKMQNDTAQG